MAEGKVVSTIIRSTVIVETTFSSYPQGGGWR
jgi:hypothetical protein